MPFVKAKEAARYFDVSSATIRKYARENSIYTEQLPSGRYRYWIDSDKPKSEINADTKYTIAYARVSSYKQRRDLTRQIQYLRKQRPDATILSDIGSFLTKSYKTILLPDFPVSKLIKKIRKESNDSKRVFNTRVARMMQSLAFYKFDQKLKSLCERRGNNLYIVDESYTSKTCGRCGNLHNSLGGSKIYKCNSCGLKIDRDINGARNILLKHLVLD